MIETKGFAAGVEALDTMLKTARVTPVGVERSGNWVTAIIRGDVAAVKSAVEEGARAADKVGKVVSTLVIPRPHAGTEAMISRAGGAFVAPASVGDFGAQPDLTSASPRLSYDQ
jgi:microcompartment protein CcmL/EutN